MNSGPASYYIINYCYCINVGMIEEDRRALIIEAIIADTRDKRIAWAERALDM